MILAWAVILGLLASVVRYRSHAVSQIATMPVRVGWMALGAVVLQIPLLRASTGPVQDLTAQRVLFLVSHLLLVVFVWCNRRLSGVPLIGLGVICNLVVIALNGGFMPITPETLVRINPGTGLAHWPVGFHYGSSKDIILPRMEVRLWELSDILVIPPPFPWPTAFSVGDLLIAAGVIVLLLKVPAGSSGDPVPGMIGLGLASHFSERREPDETQSLEPVALCGDGEHSVP